MVTGEKIKNTATRILCISLTSIFLSSCQKDETEDLSLPAPPPAAVADEDYVPVYPNTDAILVSIKNFRVDKVTGQLEDQATGGARAIFPTKSGNLENAGDVKVQNTSLTCESGNQYAYQSDLLAPDGIPFPDQKVRWNISGNANVPAMNLISTEGFPGISPIAGNPESIDRSSEFTLGLEEHIQNADSVRYVIASSNGYIYADDWAVNHSVTFKPNRLKLLAPGEGIIKIIAFRTITAFINQKMIQAINQSVVTQKVTIY